MELVALKDIPSCVSLIREGDTFHELNPVQGQEWIDTGYAALPTPKLPTGSDILSWPGITVVALASGPSLSVEQCDAVRVWRDAQPDQRRVAVINTTFRRAPWADLLYACDGAWWNVYHEEVAATFSGAKWTQDGEAAKKYGLKFIKSKRDKGLSTQVGVINQGESSGYQLLGLLQQAGAPRVYLLGYDNKGDHWHGKHPSPLTKTNPFTNWAANYEVFAEDCKLVSFEVVNLTPKTALRAFPTQNWREVFVTVVTAVAEEQAMP